MTWKEEKQSCILYEGQQKHCAGVTDTFIPKEEIEDYDKSRCIAVFKDIRCNDNRIISCEEGFTCTRCNYFVIE